MGGGQTATGAQEGGGTESGMISNTILRRELVMHCHVALSRGTTTTHTVLLGSGDTIHCTLAAMNLTATSTQPWGHIMSPVS